MSRPIHIAALDEALKNALAELPAAEATVAAVLDEHIAGLDAIHKASQDRTDLITGIQKCADSIKTLGYCLPDGVPSRKDIDDLTWSMSKDRDAARARLATKN